METVATLLRAHLTSLTTSVKMRESFCSVAPHGGERGNLLSPTLFHFVEEREQDKPSQNVRCASVLKRVLLKLAACGICLHLVHE